MTRNVYVDLCIQVQAIRRHHEGVRTPLAHAIGVAASLYTHQLANVLRILTDIRVRHLLADEVGLGKTIQALMVLNALRIQRPTLQALVIVPDRLVPQWRDEIMTRAHTAPTDEGDGDGGECKQYIRLAWDDQLQKTDIDGNPCLTLADVDPSKYQVLIVDELHRLRADVQDRIVRVAAEFEHVMVLTATPAFQRVERHAQLFAILEPERATIARWRIAGSQRGKAELLGIGDDLSKWPRWAAADVVADLIARDCDAESSCESSQLTATAMANCAYRRVIRTRRVDYAGVLPRRYHIQLVVEPLEAEEHRQALMWRYFEYLGELSRQFDPILLAKRVVLSPPSLEQRVDFLRSKGHERDGILEQVKPLVNRSQGDSRADALIDLLAEIWEKDPYERVLVAAQDNLTVDYLYNLVMARLPVIGPLLRRRSLIASRVRQGMMTEAVEDLGGFGNETNENLEAFQRGEAVVLFAPEAAQVGLNLQCARILVLYSVPWRPEEVEQWIGRLDRIGNTAAFSHDGDARTIDVYTIAQRGLVDEKVVTALARFHVFEHSVNLDGSHLDEVAALIEDAALRPGSIDWNNLENQTEAMAAEDETQELNSPLRPHLPWTVHWAKAERQHLDGMLPAPPVITDLPDHASLGPRAWDRAFEGMTRLLKRAGDYHIRDNKDPDTGRKFRTLWYKFGDRGIYGRREVASKVIFSFGADPGHENSPRYAHAYISRRGDIDIPPRRDVLMRLDQECVRRPLHFLNFGDALHDELIKGWGPQESGVTMVDVEFPEDHAIWEHGTPGLYLLRLTIIDPSDIVTDRLVWERTLSAILESITRSTSERHLNLVRPLAESTRCALESDARWLRSLLSASLRLECKRQHDGQWDRVHDNIASALLNPIAHGREHLPLSSALHCTDDELALAMEELDCQRSDDKNAARLAWSHRFPEFEQALARRLHVIAEEGHDASEVAEESLRRAKEMLSIALQGGNRPQITRAENARDAAADSRAMINVLWQERARWLQECQERIRTLQPRERMTALLGVRKMQ